MKLILLFAAVCVASAVGDKEKVAKTDSQPVEPKPKREASISGNGGYHGPSYKYLPPSSSSHASNFINDHQSVHGNVGGHDFASPVSEGIHGHSGVQFTSSGPKVETYIVQTESSAGNYGNSYGSSAHDLASSHAYSSLNGYGDSHGFSGSRGSSGSLSSFGYKYAEPSPSFGNSHSVNQHDFGSSYAVSQGPVKKIKTIVIPAQGFSSHGHANGGYARFGGYSGGSPGRTHYSNGFSNGYASHDSDIASGHNTGFFGNGFHNYEHANQASYRGSDQSVGQGGYAYELPSPVNSHSYSHSAHSNTYGVPSVLSPPYESGSVGQQAPAYAVGHKGLGHFGYSASRPQPLNTNFIGSTKYGGSYDNHEHGKQSAAHAVSSAPFKPSLFLGSSHESTSSLSTEYRPPAGGQSISSEYLPPPTSGGYDYQPPSAIYGAPTDTQGHGGSTGSVHEPENSYLPPPNHQTSYGPPATPDNSYLPPHH